MLLLGEKKTRSPRYLVLPMYLDTFQQPHIISDQIMKNMNLTFISIQTIDAHPRIAGQEQSAVMVKNLVGARLYMGL